MSVGKLTVEEMSSGKCPGTNTHTRARYHESWLELKADIIIDKNTKTAEKCIIFFQWVIDSLIQQVPYCNISHMQFKFLKISNTQVKINRSVVIIATRCNK